MINAYHANSKLTRRRRERCSHFSFFCFFCFWDDFVFCETESENKPRQTANHVASFGFSIAEEKKKERKRRRNLPTSFRCTFANPKIDIANITHAR
jgi:hypothetical protein